MQLVIPMAGRGERFLKAGYECPKYMIEIKQKTLFEYSLLSFPLEIFEKIIFIGLKEHEDNFRLTEFINTKLLKYNLESEIRTVLLENITGGQAETVLKAKDFIDTQKDLVIYNIDTFFQSKSLKEKLLNPYLKKNGVIGAFKIDDSNDKKWSFAKIDEKGKIIKTAEKDNISEFALTGMYHFSKAQDFLQIAEKQIDSNIKTLNEFYIAPMYNGLIEQGNDYVIDITDEFIPLGTPEDLDRFKIRNFS